MDEGLGERLFDFGVRVILYCRLLPRQPGDIPSTFADVNDLVETINYKPSTALEKGINEFVDWYRWYFNLNGDSKCKL